MFSLADSSEEDNQREKLSIPLLLTKELQKLGHKAYRFAALGKQY